MHNGAPQRIGQLFRDDDETPASGDLSHQIEDALRASQFLIVVCSRDTPQSKGVRHEIEFSAPSAATTYAVSYGGFFASVVLIPLWLQTNMGYTATWAGYETGIMGIVAVLSAPLVGKAVQRFDPPLVRRTALGSVPPLGPFRSGDLLKMHLVANTEIMHALLFWLRLGATIVLALAYGVAGLVHLSGPGFVLRAYRRWELAPRFHRVIGALMLLAAFFLTVPNTRLWGVLLAALVNFVSVVILLKNREYAWAFPRARSRDRATGDAGHNPATHLARTRSVGEFVTI